MDVKKFSFFLILSLFLQIKGNAVARKNMSTSATSKFNRYDVRIGNVLKPIIKDPTNIISIKNATLMTRIYKKSKIFKDKKNLFLQILAIKKSKNPLTTLEICKQIPNQSMLQKKIITWCNRNSVKFFLRKVGSKRNQLSIKQVRYFIKEISTNEKQLHLLFKSIYSDQILVKLSSIYSELLINSNQSVPPSLAKYIHIKNEFSDYIKIKDKKTISESKYATSVLRKIYLDFKKANKENDFIKLKTLSQQALSLFTEYHKHLSSRSNRIFVMIGKSFTRLHYIKESQSYFKNLFQVAQNTNLEKKDYFLFHFLWSYLQQEDYPEALKQVYEVGLLEHLDEHSIQNKFWIAYTFQKNDEYKLAHYIYSQIIKENPLHYYSVMANGLLKYNQNYFTKDLVKSNTKNEHKKVQLSYEVNQLINEASFWHYQGLNSFAHKQVQQLLKDNYYPTGGRTPSSILNLKQQVLSKLLSFLKDNHLYLPLFQTVFHNTEYIHKSTLKGLVKYLFPFEYLKKIKAQTQTANPIVVLSLIRQESSFDPRATSAPGAKGLMQLMPQTALEMNISDINNIYRPKENLKVGIKYFEHLLDTFDNNLIYSLAAYNAGPTRVKKWITNIFHTTNPLIAIENIPYRETRKYVKLIYRNIFFYNLLLKLKEKN